MRSRAQRLELAELTLRRWRPSDAAQLNLAVEDNLEHLRPWMPWVANEPLSLRHRRALLRRWQSSWRQGSDFGFGMFSAGEVIGSCGLHARVGRGGLEIGYWVDRHHTGRGTATRAAAGLTTLAFSWSGVQHVEIHHDEANGASQRVPEKLGFTLVGKQPDKVEAPGESGVSWIWRMLRADWQDPFGWLMR